MEDSTNHIQNAFQVIMFWSLLPAIVVMPLWLVMGREYVGGPSGWNGVLLMFLVAPPLFIYHVVLLILHVRKTLREESPHFLMSADSATTLVAYYVVSFLAQIFMNDGGDQGSMGSIAEQKWGLPRNVCSFVEQSLLLGTLGLLVVLMVLVNQEEEPLRVIQTRELVPTTEVV